MNGEAALFINLIFDNFAKSFNVISKSKDARQNNSNMNKAVSEAINAFVASVGQGRVSIPVSADRQQQENVAAQKLLDDANLGDNVRLNTVLHDFANRFVFEMNMLYHQINNTGGAPQMQSGLVNDGSGSSQPIYQSLHTGKKIRRVSRGKKTEDAFHTKGKRFLVDTLNSTNNLHCADPLVYSWQVQRATEDNYYLYLMRNATILLTGIDIKKDQESEVHDAVVDLLANPKQTFDLKNTLSKYCQVNDHLDFKKVDGEGVLILSGRVLQDAPVGKHLIIFEIKLKEEKPKKCPKKRRPKKIH